MRVIIEPDYDKMSIWAANYVAKCIKDANPTPEKPFKPTSSSRPGRKERQRRFCGLVQPNHSD